MPTIAKLRLGSWHTQVRHKGQYVSETLLQRDGALRRSRLPELPLDRNEPQVDCCNRRLTTVGELVRLHIEEMTAVGKPPQRSKATMLLMRQSELGAIKITAPNRERLIQRGRARSDISARPVTDGINLGTFCIVRSHAGAFHALAIRTEQVGLARMALKPLSLGGQGLHPSRGEWENTFRRRTATEKAATCDENDKLAVAYLVGSAERRNRHDGRRADIRSSRSLPLHRRLPTFVF
jgi:hypothetical protein